jgi:voltage-gated potassium channel
MWLQRKSLLSTLRYYTWFAWRRTVHRPVLSILLLLIALYVAAAIVVVAFEKVGFGIALMNIFPAFFGELGAVESPFVAVQISTIIGILASVTFIAIVTAKITSVLVELIRRGGSMAKRVRFTGHTIICGWNFQGERVINELLSADNKRKQGIVVLADREERPISDERIEFVKGDPTQDKDLVRAGLMSADSVIVLTDLTKGANEADAEALMVVLAVKSIN